MIDARQFVWWHRIRRYGKRCFIVGIGGIVAPMLTVAMHLCLMLVILNHTYRLEMNSVLIAVAIAPVYALLFAWTWSFMEHRYHATKPFRCVNCGHLRPVVKYAADQQPATPPTRCPECGGQASDHQNG